MALVLILFGVLQLSSLLAKGHDYTFNSRSEQSVQVPQTPCPHIFQYSYYKNEWIGTIKVPPPNTQTALRKTQPVKLEVKFRVFGHLPSTYIGSLELAEDSINVLEKVLQGDSSRGLLQYRLHFPTHKMLPIINLITLNGNSICTNNLLTPQNQVSTTITLNHSFYPSGSALNEKDINNKQSHSDFSVGQNGNKGNVGSSGAGHSENVHIYFIKDELPNVSTTDNDRRGPFTQENEEVRRPQITQQPQNFQTPQNYQSQQIIKPPKPFQDSQAIQNQQMDSGECGRPKISNQLGNHGETITKGSWPWLVALFKKAIMNSGVKFTCTGILITKDYAITAAHCLVEGERILVHTELLLQLGKFNLGSWTEADVQPRDVKAIHLHHPYKTGGSDANVALIQLNEKAVYNDYVQPACLWPLQKQNENGQDYTSLNHLVGKNGAVMGWGRDEQGNPVTQEPKSMIVSVVSQEVCNNADPRLRELTSNITMCTGTPHGTGSCDGYSRRILGGGLMFQLPHTNDLRWYLRGIVSVTIPDRKSNCDQRNNIVYTDVAKCGDWLSRYIHF